MIIHKVLYFKGKTDKSSSSSTKLKALVEGVANDQCSQAYRNEQRQINSNTQVGIISSDVI